MSKRVRELEDLVKAQAELISAQAKLISDLQRAPIIVPQAPVQQPAYPWTQPTFPQQPWYGNGQIVTITQTDGQSTPPHSSIPSCWPTKLDHTKL